jgi:hypothetical protein
VRKRACGEFQRLPGIFQFGIGLKRIRDLISNPQYCTHIKGWSHRRKSMHRGNKYVASLFITAALLAPMGAMAAARPQDDHERHEQEERERRVYDPYHKDYHSWNHDEDRVYRQWLETRNRAYVDYDHLKRKEQREYWNWRHEHEEHERMEHQ